MIPKSANAMKLGEYRSISYCNVIYKAISKIIANRLSKMLVELVDNAQTGFVKGRSMAENI